MNFKRGLLVLLIVFSSIPIAQASSVLIDEVFQEVGSPEFVRGYLDIPGSGTTANLYDNLVRLTISGVGLSGNPSNGLNDAFYFINSPNFPAFGGDIALSFTGNATVEGGGQPVRQLTTFINGVGYWESILLMPPYQESHIYDLVVDLRSVDRRLTLGTYDGGVGDNSGYFDVRVSQLQIYSPGPVIPEPSSLLLLGSVLFGAGIFRKKR